MGFVLLASLSALAALAALAVVVRVEPRGRAEAVVAATLLWNALIVLPIYALGLTGRLYPTTVALGSLVTSLATLALAARGLGPRALLARTARTAGELLRLPADALALTWRDRSLVFLGVAFTAGLLIYLAVAAYLGQPVPHWDPLWYHDTMTGFAIQNHGFAMVDLPFNLQKVNGYVRLCEMTQLWLVIFTDRRWSDLTNILFAPGIVAAVYVLARRYAPPITALGWGVSVVLMPACANILQSTFVDPHHAALLLGGIVFATAGTVDLPRLRDGWLAALGLALAIASKGLALVPVPVAASIAALLLLRAHWRTRPRAAVATVAGGAALIVAMAAATYVRNYLWFGNPFWPDLKLDIPALGIHWPGQGPWSSRSGPGLPVDLTIPPSQLIHDLFVLPYSVKGKEPEQIVDYGIGIAWIAIPFGVVALVTCFAVAIRAWLRRSRLPPAAGLPSPPVAIAIIVVVVAATTPALWGARYHIGTVGLVAALVAWLTSRPSAMRLGESVVSMVVVTSLMMFWWATPTWCPSPGRLVELARAPALVREVDRKLGAPTYLDVGLARERELGPGALLVFNERFSAYPSLFWNNTFSNRIMFLTNGPDFLARAAAAGATWVFLNDYDPLVRVARAPASGWQEVGILNPINGGLAFRRAPAGPPVKPALGEARAR